MISLFLALDLPRYPAWDGAGVPPDQTLVCEVVDSDFDRKKIVLKSHYEKSENEKGGSLKAEIDETGILPINESLLDDDSSAKTSGLWWAWESVTKSFRDFLDRNPYYFLKLQKDGITSPSKKGNSVLIHLVGFSKNPPRRAQLTYTGFCKLSPIYKYTRD